MSIVVPRRDHLTASVNSAFRPAFHKRFFSAASYSTVRFQALFSGMSTSLSRRAVHGSHVVAFGTRRSDTPPAFWTIGSSWRLHRPTAAAVWRSAKRWNPPTAVPTVVGTAQVIAPERPRRVVDRRHGLPKPVFPESVALGVRNRSGCNAGHLGGHLNLQSLSLRICSGVVPQQPPRIVPARFEHIVSNYRGLRRPC